MPSKFIGTWVDQRGFLATITPRGDGTFTVQYDPRANRPAFQGTETDFALAAPVLAVDFSDIASDRNLVGAVTESVDGIRRIVWTNNTIWHQLLPTPVTSFDFPEPSLPAASASA